MLRMLLALLLIGHGVIHTGFISPRPPATAGGPPWPFSVDRSWILSTAGFDDGLVRLMGIALVATTIGAFAFAALSSIGVVPTSLWPASTALGAAASLARLVLFFHPWLVAGVAIDVVLLWATLVARWSPDVLTH